MNRSEVLARTALPLTTVAALVLAAVPVTAAAQAGPVGTPTPGAVGIGDRLYPRLGNGGYDALHYGLRLRYATAKPTQTVDGRLTMTARATQALSRFDLDFSGDSVGAVTVDGEPARRTRRHGELVITPAHPIADRATFVVVVRRVRSTPATAQPEDFLATPFVATPDGSVTAGQPNAVHAIFPSNDHPRDKATFSFRFDVPTGTTAVANGVLTGRERRGRRTVWTYEQREPMATELTQLAVGRFSVLRRAAVHGVRVRDVVPTRLRSTYRRKLAVERSQIRWMEDRVGAYPFPTYGSLVVDSSLGFALETQTLSLYAASFYTGYPKGVWAPVMLHELSHQWFGDSVSPTEWSDVWLNEGHASWYEFTYAAERGYLRDDAGFTSLTGLMHSLYRQADMFRSAFGPVGRPTGGDPLDLFNPNVYGGGALVLYALRERVGEVAFRRIERAWVQRHRGLSASTADFVALASEVSGADLTDFLDDWIYGTTTPPMPGHPAWTTKPAGTSGRAALPVAPTGPRR